MKRFLRVFIVGCLGFLLLSGCGLLPLPRKQPDTLSVVRKLPSSPNMAGSDFPPLHKTIHQKTAVQKLYKKLMKLPSFPKKAVCPNDNGVSYRLTFKRSNQTILLVKAKHTGCDKVYLSRGFTKDNRTASGKKGNAFWSMLANMLGNTPSNI